MRLNGWQRIYSVLVFSWVIYIALTTYSDLAKADDKIEVAERILAEFKTLDAETAAKRKQLKDGQYESIKWAQEDKVTSFTFAIFLAIIPPLLIYSIIAWVVAGFRAQEIKD